MAKPEGAENAKAGKTIKTVWSLKCYIFLKKVDGDYMAPDSIWGVKKDADLFLKKHHGGLLESGAMRPIGYPSQWG